MIIKSVMHMYVSEVGPLTCFCSISFNLVLLSQGGGFNPLLCKYLGSDVIWEVLCLMCVG